MKRVGYFCSYVPWELLSTCNWEGIFLTPSRKVSPQVEALFPIPFCPLMKMVGEEISSKNLEGYLFALSCDASRRTWEIISAFSPQKAIFSLEVPLGDSAHSLQQFAQRLRRLATTLAASQGLELSEIEIRLSSLVEASFAERKKLGELFFGGHLPGRALLGEQSIPRVFPTKVEAPFLFSGSHLFVEEVATLLEERGVPFLEETSLGARRRVAVPFKGDLVSSSDPFLDLARLYLSYKLPCPRERTMRLKVLQELTTRLKLRGIIFLYPKFCDLALYELAWMRRNLPLPLLPLEHELTPHIPQWTTRIDAFLEATSGEKVF